MTLKEFKNHVAAIPDKYDKLEVWLDDSEYGSDTFLVTEVTPASLQEMAGGPPVAKKNLDKPTIIIVW